MTKDLRVVAACIEQAGRGVLIQQRPHYKAQGGLWEFPGGKVEEFENDTDALVRECAEELGVRVRVGELLWSVVHSYPDRIVQLCIYRVFLEDKTDPHPHDALVLRWVDRSQLGRFDFCPADIPFVQQLQNETEHALLK